MTDAKLAREAFNAAFTEEKYQALLKDIHPGYNLNLDFRIAETPIFVTKAFKREMLGLFEDVKEFLTHADLSGMLKNAVPEAFRVANESKHPAFVAIDFAVCQDENGQLFPQLIEFQGIATLFCYQRHLNLAYQRHYDIPNQFSPYVNFSNEHEFLSALQKIVLADEKPENVIMLDIEPEKQKTRIDFIYTKKDLGIQPVCISDVFQVGSQLFYYRDGVKLPIKRIYNRLIFDELDKRTDIKAKLKIDFKADLDVTWIAHPNWFFKVSKFAMPFMNSKYVPQTRFLNEITALPENLEDYVLKPLFSFAGAGVHFDVSREIIEGIEDPENYILQKKVVYHPFIPTPDIPAKAEIRMMCFWEKELIPAMCLARLSKGKIMGVDYNKDKTWVGSSAVFFEK